MSFDHHLDFGVLRELRKQENWSIADLSERCGVAASVISKLERNQSIAELDTLLRIARAFNLTLSDLIHLVERRVAHRVAEEAYDSDGFSFRRVRFQNLNCMQATAPRGARLSKPSLHRDDYELCWVQSGEVEITLAEEKYRVKTGEALQFDALVPHTYEAREECKLTIVHIRKGKRF